MTVTVVFPKQSCYYGKNVDTQRIYSALFKKYLTMLKDAGCRIEYLIEDCLANDFVTQMQFNECEAVTCLSSDDIAFFNVYQNRVDLQPYVFRAFESLKNYSGCSDKKFTVPITLLKEDREAYINKRIEAYHKRLRSDTDCMLKSKKAVLMFRADNGLDRYTALRETVIQGDGRLCIEVNINSNMAVSYYGGVFIQEEYLPTILAM